ncbi:MAG: thioredoxin domain-containing protein [Candidatus Binatia bacterium]
MADSKMKDERKVTSSPGAPRATPSLTNSKLLLAIRILAVLGLSITVYLSVLHLRAGDHGDFSSPFCSISTTINCNAVLGSAYARMFGLPVAVWAAVTYLIMLGVSFAGSRSMLITLCCWAFAFSVYMAGISLFAIKAACLFCMSLYAINTGLLISAVALSRSVLDFTFQKALTTLAVCLVLAVGLGWVQTQASVRKVVSEGEFSSWYNQRPRVTVTAAERHVKGLAQAPVTVSEFVDFRCPSCARAREVLKQVSEKYPEDVRIVFHHYPLDNECNSNLPRQVHVASCLASFASECAAEQGKFWEYAEILFTEQQREYSRPDLEAYARSVGLNVDQFNTCMNSGQTKALVRKDIEEAERIGVKATPTLVVNGRLVEGLPSEERFDQIIAIEKQQPVTQR